MSVDRKSSVCSPLFVARQFLSPSIESAQSIGTKVGDVNERRFTCESNWVSGVVIVNQLRCHWFRDSLTFVRGRDSFWCFATTHAFAARHDIGASRKLLLTTESLLIDSLPSLKVGRKKVFLSSCTKRLKLAIFRPKRDGMEHLWGDGTFSTISDAAATSTARAKVKIAVRSTRWRLSSRHICSTFPWMKTRPSHDAMSLRSALFAFSGCRNYMKFSLVDLIRPSKNFAASQFPRLNCV